MPAWVNSPKLAPLPPAIAISDLFKSSNFCTYMKYNLLVLKIEKVKT